MQKNLYRVQDFDRPMYISAGSFDGAVAMWRAQLERENPGEDYSDEQPDGVEFLARGGGETPELLLG